MDTINKDSLVPDVDHLEKNSLAPTTTYQKALELGTHHVTHDIEAERKLLWKTDLRLLPVMCVTNGLQYYDKILMGQAAIFGLRNDLDLLSPPFRYSNATMIFYVGYIIGCYPISFIAQKYPPGRVCAILCLLWAAIILSTAACNDYTSLMINRTFLGIVESGINPSFMLVTGMWYTHREQSQRAGIWYSASAGFSIITPLMTYGLGSIKGGSLHSWQYMYLAAGSLTALWSIVIWMCFPDSPVKARGFTEDEKVMVLQRVRVNNQGAANSTFKWHQCKETLLSYQFWIGNLISCLVTVTAGPLNAFSSIIFKGFGFNTFHSLLLNIPIGALAIICINGSAFLSRKIRHSRLFISAAACMVVILGCALTSRLPAKNIAGRLAGYYLLNFFSAAYVHCIGIGTSNISGSTKKTVTAAGIFVSYCLGNIIGPLLFPSNDAPRYLPGFTGTMICLAIAAASSLFLRFLLARENSRRDALYGPPGIEHGLEDLTDKENKDFRYHL